MSMSLSSSKTRGVLSAMGKKRGRAESRIYLIYDEEFNIWMVCYDNIVWLVINRNEI
jgi:hypothetical protein